MPGRSARTSSLSVAKVYFGDEGNTGSRLGGYGKVDIRTSYDLNENVQFYGLVDNVLDAHYGLYMHDFNQEAARNAGAVGGLGAAFFGTYNSNNKSITPAPPVAAYGGVKLRF